MLISAVLVLVFAVAGGAAYLLLRQAGDRTAAQGSSGSAAPSQARHSSAPPPTHHGDLRNFLIAAPSGSQPWPHPLGTGGKLSLHQAASLGTDAKVRRAVLTEDHFTHGAVRSWISKSGTWADVRLYQFASPADAQAFFHTDYEASARNTPAADQSQVSNVPGAWAFADPKPNSGGYVSVLVLGVKGDVVFLADVAEHSDTVQLATPKRLAREQYSKL